MPLDFDALYQGIYQMVATLPSRGPGQKLASARAYLREVAPDDLRHRLKSREHKVPWLVALPINSLADTFAPCAIPDAFSVVAADGSSVPPDRHSPVRYYMINIGHAAITYGPHAHAAMSSCLQFCHQEQDLYFDPAGKRIPIDGTRLGVKMAVEEMVGLYQAAKDTPRPTVALCDGTLILWNMQNEDKELQAHYLERYLRALDGFRREGMPIASYISFPGSDDLKNSLRIMLCHTPGSKCSQCPHHTREQELCAFLESVRDRNLFHGLLDLGHRSDIFESQSAILQKYREHHIQFFYINVGDEIARVEAPQWVMNDDAMLDLVHGTVIDQCRRSGQYPPYPPALIEAHEQAVITTAERQTIETAIEQTLARAGITYLRSAKDRSKRSRGV